MRKSGYYWVRVKQEWSIKYFNDDLHVWIDGYDGVMNDEDFDEIHEKNLTHP